MDKSSSAAEIKKAFYKLAKRFHPDKAGGDLSRFQQINKAYEVLGDPRLRARYDQSGKVSSTAARTEELF